jgi:E3 ubiquitin-protein ligase ATL4
VEEESEVTISQSHRRSMSKESGRGGGLTLSEEPILAAEVASARGSLLDRLSTSLSSRTTSFRGSGRLFTGSSGRSEIAGGGDYGLGASRVGEEISELFRWFSGV